MKRVIASLFGTVAGLVMLLSFKTHSQTSATIPAAVSTAGGDDSTAGTSSDTTSGTSGKTTSSSTSATKTASGTYTGDTVDTQWGPVQVRVTVSNGRVTSASAIVYPNGNPR